MKIAPEDGADVEPGLCNVDRMAEILLQLLVDLDERYDRAQVPAEFMKDLECATFAAGQLREMVAALKVEFYDEMDRTRRSTIRAVQS